jgi:hypothetical protein
MATPAAPTPAIIVASNSQIIVLNFLNKPADSGRAYRQTQHESLMHLKMHQAFQRH